MIYCTAIIEAFLQFMFEKILKKILKVPVFVLNLILSGEARNTNFLVFGLTRPGL
jgi:hypothetical protein